jgi:hypothetical protein
VTTKGNLIRTRLGWNRVKNLRHITGDIWEYQNDSMGSGCIIRRHITVQGTDVILGLRYWGVYREKIGDWTSIGPIVSGDREFVGWASEPSEIEALKRFAPKPGYLVGATCNYAEHA